LGARSAGESREEGSGKSFSRKGRKERKGNGEGVVESKSLYNRFVYFAFFVVKNWKAAKGKGKREMGSEKREVGGKARLRGAIGEKGGYLRLYLCKI
jgi:hypothetical protein